jgi:hypothetical protein
MSRLVTPAGEICKQCLMPWDYSYSGPATSEIKEMKEGGEEMLSDESDTKLESPDREDVPDHRSRSRSPLGQDESAPGGASPVRRVLASCRYQSTSPVIDLGRHIFHFGLSASSCHSRQSTSFLTSNCSHLAM